MSRMRISGMVSGMDTDTMVQNMMKVERMKISRFEQNKQIALWRQESYNNMNKLFANFILNTKKDIGLKTTTSTGITFDKSYASLDYVKKASSLNETVATVSSTNKAVNGSFSIEVMELAKGASFTSAELKENALEGVKHLEFQINGVKIVVDSKDGTKDINMEDVVKAINSAKETVDGKEVALGVTAFYDKKNGRLFMQTTETGEGAKIDISDGLGTILGYEGINGVYEDGKGAKYIKSQDAKIKFNETELNYSSNNFELNGINITAKTKGTATINVNTNVEGIMEKVEKLIKDYNELIDSASKLLGEKKYASYKPLSEEERKEMKESDLKLWDEKAKSGLLNSDETINRTLQSMRTDLYKTLEGVEGFNHITQIGISTETYARGAAGGKLQIDTEKLRKAIEEDPEGVMELLFKDGKFTSDGKEDIIKAGNSTKGVFTRVYDDLIDGMKAIIEKSGTGENSDLYRNVKSNILIDFVTTKSSISDIDKSITEMNRQMNNLNILFAKKEDSYYAKFTQMEKYMQQMSSQSGWLSQQFM